MTTFILVIHILVSIFLIVVVLLQAGKGASIGASFGGGGGSGQAVFGSSQGSFMGKVTTAAAVVFMLTSLTLAYISASPSTSSIMTDVKTPPKMEMEADSMEGMPVPGSEKARGQEDAIPAE